MDQGTAIERRQGTAIARYEQAPLARIGELLMMRAGYRLRSLSVLMRGWIEQHPVAVVGGVLVTGYVMGRLIRSALRKD